MKLWEVLKALEENPKKKFECSLIGGYKGYMYTKDDYYRLDIHGDDGILISQQRGGGAFNDNVHINKDWQEIKQPVTWQEAIEAWANGKKIKCVIDGMTTLYKSKSGLQDSLGWAVSPVHIKNGTWYIED